MNDNELTIRKADGTDHVVSAYLLGKVMTPEFLAKMLTDWLNNFNSEISKGNRVAEYMMRQHRTLQGSFVNFIISIIFKMAETTYTDARNATAIDTCKRIKKLYDDEEIYYQPTI